MTTLKQVAASAGVPLLDAYRAIRSNDQSDHQAVRVRQIAGQMNYMLKITMRDVADLAEVSVGTVSNVLNERVYVRDDTRKRVQEAMRALDYRPNLAARILKTAQTRTIGYECPLPLDTTNDNGMLGLLTRALQMRGYYLLTFSALDEDPLEDYRSMTMMSRVDGFVLSNLAEDDQRPAFLLQEGTPFTIIGSVSDTLDVADRVVERDWTHGATQLAALLQGAGHKVAAILRPQPGMLGDSDALAVALGLAMDAVGIAHEDVVLPLSVDAAREHIDQLLDAANPPTALLGAHDWLGVSALQVVGARGLTPGQDIAVTAMHDTHVTDAFGLTAFTALDHELVDQATEMLVGLLQRARNPLNPTPIKAPVPVVTQLIARSSTMRE